MDLLKEQNRCLQDVVKEMERKQQVNLLISINMY